MNEMLQFMLIIFGDSEYDWLGFKITDNNPLTCHHIRKYHDGGSSDVNNMALLTIAAHRYLHDIELFDIELYYKINNFLKEINTRRSYPSKEEYEMINEWLGQYEVTHEKILKNRIKFKKYNIKLIERLIPEYSLYHPTNFRMNLQRGVNLYEERVITAEHRKFMKKKKKSKKRSVKKSKNN